jgi:hypothetical protein
MFLRWKVESQGKYEPLQEREVGRNEVDGDRKELQLYYIKKEKLIRVARN